MLPWKLRKRHSLPASQNLLAVYFSLAKFQLVSCNISFPMIRQRTYTHKTAKLCSATLTDFIHSPTLPISGIQSVHIGPYHVTLFNHIRHLHIPIIYLICPPKFCISIVFKFSWDGCNTQEKWKTKVMKNWGGGGQIRCIVGDVQVAYSFLNANVIKRGHKKKSFANVVRPEKNKQTTEDKTFMLEARNKFF